MGDFSKIEALIAQGWDLTVTARSYGKSKFHATVYLGRVHGPDSHHFIGNSVSEVVEGLERYIDAREREGPTLMTQEEFMVEWCAKTGFERSVFDSGERVAVPCYCGGNACKGWKSLTNDPDRLREHAESDGVAARRDG